jgi:hypothetical protein
MPKVTTTKSKPPEARTRTNWVFMQPIQVTGQIYSDQTGCFPTTSSHSNKYIMIVYDYDSNAILAEPITSRTKAELLHAYTKLHTYLCDRGLKPILQRLDSEAPGKLRHFMTDHDVSFQLVPPHTHCRNGRRRESNRNVERSLHCRPQYHRPSVSTASVVPTHRSSHHNPQSPSPVTPQPTPVCQSSTQWRLRF